VRPWVLAAVRTDRLKPFSMASGTRAIPSLPMARDFDLILSLPHAANFGVRFNDAVMSLLAGHGPHQSIPRERKIRETNSNCVVDCVSNGGGDWPLCSLARP
jgi:hypothetical protein